MKEYFVTYDRLTGEERWRGSGLPGIAAEQKLPEDIGILTVSAALYEVPLADIPLSYLAAARWAEVKAKRDAIIDGGAATPFGAVDSYELARSNIAGAALAALIAKGTAQPYTVNWTLLDNSVVTLDADQMIVMGLAVLAHVNAAHDRGRDLRDQINAAADVAALLTIDISSGWAA